MDGWITIYRKIQEKNWYKDSEYVHVWLHLILNANYIDKKILVNEKEIEIKRGQLLTSRKLISEKTGIQQSKIYRILERFANEHQIEQQKTNKYTIITIPNYDLYQKNRQQNEQQQSEQQNEHQSEQQNEQQKNNKIQAISTLNKWSGIKSEKQNEHQSEQQNEHNIINNNNIPITTTNNNINNILEKRGYGREKPFIDCFTFCEKEYGRLLSPSEIEKLAFWRDNWFDDKVINLAISKSTLNGVRALSYTEKIINSWHDKGYKTYEECMNESIEFKNRHANENIPVILEDYDWLNED